MEMANTGNVVKIFEVMSNEIGSAKVLYCPNDATRMSAKSFFNLANSNLSYFIGVDVKTNDSNANRVLSGDGNLTVDGHDVKSGLLQPSAKTSTTWTRERHGSAGYLGFADGSVQPITNYRLTDNLGTNRLAVP